jgi:flagellin-like protein
MKELVMKSRKAISPVIATVILVAVAITIAVAVSYWMSGIAGQYTKFEKVEIQSASVEKNPGTYVGWKITLTLKNSGSATSTLNGVYVDDLVAGYGLATAVPSDLTKIQADVGLGATQTVSINSGQSGIVTVYIGGSWPTVTNPITSGTTIDIKIHSAGGMDYIKLIGLT